MQFFVIKKFELSRHNCTFKIKCLNTLVYWNIQVVANSCVYTSIFLCLLLNACTEGLGTEYDYLLKVSNYY